MTPSDPMHPAARAVASCDAFARLARELPAPGSARTIGGAAGSLPMAVVAALARAFPNRLWVVTASSPGDAADCLNDLETLLGRGAVSHYPQRESSAEDGGADPRPELSGARVEALQEFLAGSARVLVATHRALQELAPIPADLADLRLRIATGQQLARDELVEALAARGFERTPLVEAPGCYAVRGGLVDLYSFGAAGPARVEFWGDEVESIRHFDVLDQRSTGTTAGVDILPVRFGGGESAEPRRGSLLDRLPGDAVLVQRGGKSWAELGAPAWEQAEARHRDETLHGNPAPSSEELFLRPEALAARAGSHPRILFSEDRVISEDRAVPEDRAGDLVFRTRLPPAFNRDTRALRASLENAAAAGAESHILCDNPGQAARLRELLEDRAGRLPPRCRLTVGSLTGGFLLDDATPPTHLLTDHEIFRRNRKLRRGKRFRGAAALESLAQLTPGDHVVHLEHGIGRFEGLEKTTIGDEAVESLMIRYDRDEVLRVPVYQLDQVERWVGAHPDDAPRSLHRIGGRRWKTLKRKTQAAINRTTAELLELHAVRRTRLGHAFSPDGRWQQEMEASFLYEDTPDQRRAAEEVKRDMEAPGVMDRLVCGDAGYGKTEVAIRAAFKAVQDGKQVALLAPTTVLVAQHARSFGDRLADYPVRVAALSRLDPPSRQRQVVAEVAAGTVDIVIGTQRLLSADVSFRDLGLVVIDEEQRLGVRQKERLKKIRTTVDVLTLTATPIPRTLYLSLAGVRDLSLIRTPPRDRMPIVTHVVSWSDGLIVNACQAELDRGGQVFFLHNRVETIETAARRVRRLLPGAVVEVAHGQMPARSLDLVMTRFVAGESDILVCSSIIENGLDVFNANTLIVTRADRFGLSQLYQIRGRVGRWDRRAYCYLIVPERITVDAERRLRVLEHHTELGSGYQIALRDLEVRGAGNLLGEDQSGFAHAVGIDTYMRLMEDAVRNLRGAPDPADRPRPDVGLDRDAYLPDAYIADPHQKLHLYRRLSKARGRDDVGQLAAEIADRYGRLPPQAAATLDKALISIVGREAGASRILVRGSGARINFRPEIVPRMSALEEALRGEGVRIEVRRVAPLSVVLECSDRGRLTNLIVRAMDALGGVGSGQARTPVSEVA